MWLGEGTIPLPNKEEICEGRNNFDNDKGGKIVIDLILVNMNMQELVKRMGVDEIKVETNFSDPCLF